MCGVVVTMALIYIRCVLQYSIRFCFLCMFSMVLVLVMAVTVIVFALCYDCQYGADVC